MTYGATYTVTFKTAVNRDWTRTQDLRFCGLDSGRAMFQDADLFNSKAKPFGLTLDRIVSIEEA
jgi:hypothetical protein